MHTAISISAGMGERQTKRHWAPKRCFDTAHPKKSPPHKAQTFAPSGFACSLETPS